MKFFDILFRNGPELRWMKLILQTELGTTLREHNSIRSRRHIECLKNPHVHTNFRGIFTISCREERNQKNSYTCFTNLGDTYENIRLLGAINLYVIETSPKTKLERAHIRN